MATKWTFMVYMAGNNSLSDDAGVDLKEMRRQGSTSEVNVLAFVKQEGSNARRFKVAKGADEPVEDLGPDVDSGDPRTVVEFIKWAVRTAPAARYALVLWNHGGGWRAADLEQLYAPAQRAAGVTRHELNKRAGQRVSRTLFSTTARQILALPSDDREILADDTTGHSLDTIELQRVLHAANAAIGHHVDLLGMDACLMTTLEVAYQLRQEVGVIAGSEEEEPAQGWPYTSVLGALAANPDMSATELARAIVARYVESYQRSADVITQCALDPGQVDAFAKLVDRLERGLRPLIGRSWQDLVRAQARSAHFAFDLVDLRTLCAGVIATGIDQNVKAAAAAVADALKVGSLVVAEGHRGRKVEQCAGVSVYFPPPTAAISRYYEDLEFAKRHRWDELLREYHHAVASA